MSTRRKGVVKIALTRKMLAAMGIESEKIDQIIEAHTESTDGLKAKVEEERAKAEELREQAAKVPGLEQQVEALKAADEGDEWEAKYNQAKADADRLQGDLDKLRGEKTTLEEEYESFKGKVESDRANAEKLELYKGLLREIGLDEKRVDKAARLKPLDELTVEDGKLAGYDDLKASEAEEWAEFIPKSTGVRGQNVPTPPKSEPSEDGPDPAIQASLKARHERLYGKAENTEQ